MLIRMLSISAGLLLCLVMTGCAGFEGSQDHAAPAVRDIAVTVGTTQLDITVEATSPEMWNRGFLGSELEKEGAVDQLLGARIRTLVEEGYVELANLTTAEHRVVLDDVRVEDGRSEKGLAEGGTSFLAEPVDEVPSLDACLVYEGVQEFGYSWSINDEFGCRIYYIVDSYDVFNNQCDGTSTWYYLGSTLYGPYSCW